MFLDAPSGYRLVRRRILPAEEGERTLRLLHPCRVAGGAPSFRWERGAPEIAWERWRRRVFDPVLGPALVGALHAARWGHLRDLLALEQQIDGAVTARTSAALRAAGARLVLAMVPPASVRPLWRYRSWVREGAVVGHLCSVFALRAAAFHVPTRTALAAWLQCEWQDATGDDALPPGGAEVAGLPACGKEVEHGQGPRG